MDEKLLIILLPLWLGWIADRMLGDPLWLPHPVVGFGRVISWGEKQLNKGKGRGLKGGIFSILLILVTFAATYVCVYAAGLVGLWLQILCSAVFIFYGLAGKTLAVEVSRVFAAVDRSTEEGRQQVARIVGRDTSALSPQQIRTAALETLAENLSDGVIAPLFWYMLLGVPGMMAYKMVNTLDSMIGYKNERYTRFGCWAARIDDAANYIPARLTAALMVLVAGCPSLFAFVRKYGRCHASPNSGYPEAALAGILGCRFGGPNVYFGKTVDKPYIGDVPKTLTTADMQEAIAVNRQSETLMLVVVTLYTLFIYMMWK